MSPQGNRPFDPIDIGSLEFWGRPPVERAMVFDELRASRPISWQRSPEGGISDPTRAQTGFWALLGHADIVKVSRDPKTFCSGQGVSIEDVAPEINEAASSFLGMDAPRHTILRRLISATFTPRRVAMIEEQIAHQAERIVRDVVEQGLDDVVNQISRRLPMWTISEMIGVPASERESISRFADAIVSANDPDALQDAGALERLIDAVLGLTSYAAEMATSRRRKGADDLMTQIATVEIDDTRLTDIEIGAFFVLLAVAGNDTTRQTISHNLLALSQDESQHARLSTHLATDIGMAVEEMIRWATPVIQFRRTATTDVNLGDATIMAGDKVVLFYEAANRDSAVFVSPHRFDLRRTPNAHLGFGGGGIHFCLGAALARTQLRCIFTEVLTHLPSLRVSNPVYLKSNFINGIKHMDSEL